MVLLSKVVILTWLQTPSFERVGQRDAHAIAVAAVVADALI